MPPKSYTLLPKRTTLTYKQRLEVCEYAKKNPALTREQVADWAALHYRLPKAPSTATIRKICHQEDELRRALSDAPDAATAGAMRKKSHVAAPEVEAALVRWLAEKPSDVKVKGKEIQAKAEELAEELGMDAEKRPKFSKGWLCAFQERYQINRKKNASGKTSVSSSRKRPSLSDPIPSKIVLTYKQRDELCEYAKQNPTLNKTQLAEWATLKFHLRKYISNVAVGKILKRADDWKRVPAKEAKAMRHWRSPCVPELDTLLASWLSKKHERGIKVKGKEIVERAKAMAEELDIPEEEQPKFSKGWLSSFMSRHSFVKTRMSKLVKDIAAREKEKENTAASMEELEEGDGEDDIDYDEVAEHEGDQEEDGRVSGGESDDEEEDDEGDLEQPARKKSRVEHLLN